VSAQRQLRALLAGAALCVAVGAGVSFWTFGQIEQAAASRAHTTVVLDRSGELLSALQDAEAGQRGYALTGDEKFLEPYLAVRGTIRRQLTALRELTAIPEARQHLDAVGPALDAKMAELAQVIALRQAQDSSARLGGTGAREGQRLMDSIRREMKAFAVIQETAQAGHEAQFQADLRRLFAIMAIGSLFVLLLALSFAYSLNREAEHRLQEATLRGTKKLLEIQNEANAGLQQANARLETSEEKLSVTLRSIGDGMIATDAAGCVTLLNPVAEKLTGWTLAEALGAPVAHVFQIINRDTRQAVPVPVGTALAGGMVQVLARHTVLIARDGRECAIADSCAPIRDRGGRAIGAVLIFRDVTAEQATEAAGRDSAALIQVILDTVADGIITLHASGGVIERANQAAERMFGYPSAGLIGQNFRELIPELDRDQRNGSIDDYRASDEARAAGLAREVVGRCKDGRTFPLEITVSEMQVGGARYFTGVLRDITARKRAEDALFKAGALQRAIFNSANFSSIATDARGVIQIFNVGAERMLGYAAGEMLNTITPADISDPLEVIARAQALSAELGTPILPGFEALVFKASRGIEDIYELTYIRKDGSRFPAVVSVTALRDVQNAIIGYLLIGTDNTARKRIEGEQEQLAQRLRDQQFYTRSLFESNIDALMTTDPSGIITDVNKQMEALTGSTRDELIGAPFRNSFTDPARAEAGIKLVLSEKKVTNYELTARARDGKETLVSYNATTFYDRGRRLQGVFAAARDVTERQRAEENLRRALTELNLANAELAQASRLKDEFLANMSHELRTPLNAILGLSEALVEQVYATLTPRQLKSVTTISTSGQHLLVLINDILDLSKIEAGKLELNLEPVNVEEFCQSCLVFVRTQAMQKKIAVAFDYDGRGPTFLADPKRLKQVLVNLLTNAVKFTPVGGRIGLTVAVPADEEVVRFTVWDTGIGIAPADAAKLFQAFTQIDSGLSRAQEGTGLGLALVAKLVELHGGGVTLESEPGQGSRFTVTLPRAVLSASVAPLAATVASSETRRPFRRALIIEDDPVSGAIVANLLAELGLTSVVHLRGEGAVEATLREQPDVILLDILLPGESGWVVLAKLKEHPGTRDIPVLVVSFVDEPQKSRALGAMAHLTKPITRAQLAKCFQLQTGATGLSIPLFGEASRDTRKVILLAEDNEANVEMLGGYLEDRGYALRYAANGLMAVTLAREVQPAVILMDIQMPVMDGLTAIREIRATPALAATPIVALTALAMPGDRERCIAAGATEYMSKPVSLKALAELVKRLLAAEARK
jgi:PAS domain S-box-containing protein